ncbi:MFS transporter [Alkalihalobacillus sp. LMS39]|uniref:MFS transporter n=1 Tax=Alkalihalobacillus sp. LMS39 TaxID=2924032 RepID=UPI001FB22057|nr:MFS transporter [Alkalihalobacillus sp. LMS39]UOE94094.1 MFS transporter [Alkalihalobacillus sp. LMS39]
MIMIINFNKNLIGDAVIILKNKNIWILLTGEFIAGFGLWLGIIGDLAFMQDKVPSDFHKSLILAIGILAGIAIGPLSGRIVDQYKKKNIMLCAGIGRLISVGFMFIAIETGSIAWMLAFLISINVAAAFYFPALQATIPLVVEEKKLLHINGLYMNISTLSRVLGTAAAGVFLTIMSLSMLYVIAFISYALLLVLTTFLNIKEPNREKEKSPEEENTKQSFKELFPIIKERPTIFPTLFLTLVPLLFIGGFNLIVINISEALENPSIKGWLYTIEGVAFIFGTLFVRRFGFNTPFKKLFILSIVIAFAQLMLFYVQFSYLTILAFVLFGFAVGCFFPIATMIFQMTIPPMYHGRFFSFRGMVDDFMYQIILLSTGLMLDTLGLQQMMITYGILSFLITSWFYLRVKQLKVDVVSTRKVS